MYRVRRVRGFPGSALAGPAPYLGPGNIYGAAIAWWGLRGFSTQYAAPGNNPAIDVVDAATGTITTTVNILSTGDLDVSKINQPSVVKKLYDQSGNARHLSQATLALMPALTLNGLGNHPTITFSGAQRLAQNTGTAPSNAIPFAMSIVGGVTGNFASNQILWDTDGRLIVGFNDAGANDNNWFMYAQSVRKSFGVTDAVPHAVQLHWNNGTNSISYVDGVSTSTNNPGSTALTSGSQWSIGSDHSSANFWTGIVCEFGIFQGTQTGNFAAVNAQQHKYWTF